MDCTRPAKGPGLHLGGHGKARKVTREEQDVAWKRHPGRGPPGAPRHEDSPCILHPRSAQECGLPKPKHPVRSVFRAPEGQPVSA